MWGTSGGAIINLRNNLFDDTLHQFRLRELHVDWRFNRRPEIDSRLRMMASWAICGEVGGHVCEASPEFPYFCVNFASFLFFLCCIKNSHFATAQFCNGAKLLICILQTFFVHLFSSCLRSNLLPGNIMMMMTAARRSPKLARDDCDVVQRCLPFLNQDIKLAL